MRMLNEHLQRMQSLVDGLLRDHTQYVQLRLPDMQLSRVQQLADELNALLQPKDVRQLTDEERQSLKYFHDHKGDMTRYVRWEDLQPVLERWHPELLQAVRNVATGNQILDALVREL